MQKIIFGGQVYSSVDEMPPAARAAYQSAMAALDADQPRSGFTTSAGTTTTPPGQPPPEAGLRQQRRLPGSWRLRAALLGVAIVGLILLYIWLAQIPR